MYGLGICGSVVVTVGVGFIFKSTNLLNSLKR